MASTKPAPSADFGFTVPVGAGARPWLRQTLRSLAAQPVTVSIAICAVEDSEALQAAIAEFNALIAYVRIGPDDGQSDAINEGWRALDAHYYGWLNDDDMLHPEATLRAMALFDGGADVVHGRSDILSDGWLRQGYGDRPIKPAPDGNHLLDDNTIAQPSTFVSRKALDSVNSARNGPLGVEHHYAMDWDLWIRLYKSGAHFAATPQTLSITRWYDGTKTSAHGLAKYGEYYRVLRSHSRRLRAAWIVINTVVNNLARYGPAPALFTPVDRALHRLHAARSEQADRSSDVLEPAHSPQIHGAKVEVFHFDDKAHAVWIDGDKKLSTVNVSSGEAVTFGVTEVGVDFD